MLHYILYIPKQMFVNKSWTHSFKICRYRHLSALFFLPLKGSLIHQYAASVMM